MESVERQFPALPAPFHPDCWSDFSSEELPLLASCFSLCFLFFFSTSTWGPNKGSRSRCPSRRGSFYESMLRSQVGGHFCDLWSVCVNLTSHRQIRDYQYCVPTYILVWFSGCNKPARPITRAKDSRRESVCD